MRPAELDERIERKWMQATMLQHALVCPRCRLVLERLLMDEGTIRHAIGEGVFPPMLPQIRIQEAHDLVMEALQSRKALEDIIPPEIQGQLAMAADALCWALDHNSGPDHSGRFGRNFAEILEILKSALKLEAARQDPAGFFRSVPGSENAR